MNPNSTPTVRIIHEEGDYRIKEIKEKTYNIEDIKRDLFAPQNNVGIDPEEVKANEHAFENNVYERGVYSYTLEKRNPNSETEWEVQDLCTGFIGPYEFENHYIVDEFKLDIKALEGK